MFEGARLYLGALSGGASRTLLCVSLFSCFAFGTTPVQTAQIETQYGKLPLYFAENHGQAVAQARFVANARGVRFSILSSGISLALPASAGRSGRSVTLRLAGANPSARVVGLDPLSGRVNYLLGSDPSRWRTEIPTFARVKIEQAYPGIDVVFYGSQGNLEYDLVVAANADPERVRLKFEQFDEVSLQPDGQLRLRAGVHSLVLKQPAVYQESDGVRQPIAGRYKTTASGRQRFVVGFQLGAYDRARPLVIDPTLIYSTPLVSGSENAKAIAVDTAGNAYLTGYVPAGDPALPTTGGVQPKFGGGVSNAFVVKLNAEGTALLYATYLGGSDPWARWQQGSAIAVDAAGNAWVAGTTNAADFPAIKPAQACVASEQAFVSRLDPTGSSLTFSTCLQGVAARTAAVDAAGNAYIAGNAFGRGLLIVNAYQPDLRGQNAFLVKFTSTGQVAYSSYIGGSGTEQSQAVGVDADGNAYIAGHTTSQDFPLLNALQPKPDGGDSSFLAKFDPSGSSLIYSTYFVNSNGYPVVMTVDANGSAYLAGSTGSPNLPLKNALRVWNAGAQDAQGFVSKFPPAGSPLMYSTYLGYANVNAIAVDRQGRAYLTGSTVWSDLPVKNAIQSSLVPGSTGALNAFVMALKPDGSDFIYCTYLGGGSDNGVGIAADAAGSAYITGTTDSPNFPLSNPLFSFPGTSFSFVTKISPQDLLRLYTVSPPAVLSGTAGFDLTVSGARFSTASVVRWNGADRPTTFVSASQLEAKISAADVTNPGDGQVSVYGGADGAGLSNSLRFPIQALSACTYAVYISPTALPMTSRGGSQRIIVQAPPGCPWTATTNATWLTLSSSSGTGNGAVVVTAADDGGTGRSAYVVVAGKTVTIGQPSRPVITFISPSSMTAGGADLTVVGIYGANFVPPSTFCFSPHDCRPSYGSEVHVSSPAYPTYSVWIWSSNLITVTLSPVKSETRVLFTVSYNGETSDPAVLPVLPPGGCDGRLGLVSQTVGAKAGTAGAFLTMTSPDCAWTAKSNDDWIKLTSPASGTGNAPVFFSFSAYGINYKAPSRAGTVNIGGVTHLLVQNPSQYGPSVNEGGIVNAASFAANQAVAPGSLASIFGLGLAPATLGASTTPLPTLLISTSVRVISPAGTLLAPLLFVSPEQINFQIPWELAGQSQAVLTVVSGSSVSLTSSVATLPLTSVTPAIFSLNGQGSGPGAILISNSANLAQPAGSIPGRVSRPANRGEYISIYCNGLGPLTTTPPASGALTPLAPLYWIASRATVSIGGTTVTPTFAGLAPGFAGLYQVDVQVPAQVTPGDAVPVVLSVAGASSNTLTIAVQ